jgi:quinol monooxygenase YgiN
MSVSFLAAGAATAVAAVVTGMLVWRLARLPRLDQAAWVCAAAGLTIALAAQALGYHQGFNAAAFRAIQVAARLVAPMALIWGLAEVTAKSFGVRFGARLGLAALTSIAGVVMASDPLSGVTFTTAWPTAAAHYQLIPNVVLLAVGAATVLPALTALTVAAVRARREPGWREALPAVSAAAVAALLTQALQVRLHVNSGYVAICLVAAGLTWLAGHWSSRLQLAELHKTAAAGDDTGWGEAYTDGGGYGGYRADTGGYRRVGTDTDFSGLYRADTGGFGRAGGDTDFGGLYRPDTGGFGEVSSDTGYGFYRTDTDLRPVVNGGPDRPHKEPVPGIIETGDILPVAFDVFTPAARRSGGQGEEETARLYGQIAIYTLIDGQAEEFDRLAQAVVEKVKALEPDTLAYIVHGVPSAPMQRILYEVYRDEAAFTEHGQQPYIQDFEEERKPCVLATNVIELGVRQAKLSPLGGPPGPSGPPPRQAPPRQAPPPQAPPRQAPPPQAPPRQAPSVQPSGQRRPAAPRPRPGPPGQPDEPDPRGRPVQQPRPAQQPRSAPPAGPGQSARPGPDGQPGQAVPPDGQPARPRSTGTR